MIILLPVSDAFLLLMPFVPAKKANQIFQQRQKVRLKQTSEKRRKCSLTEFDSMVGCWPVGDENEWIPKKVNHISQENTRSVFLSGIFALCFQFEDRKE